MPNFRQCEHTLPARESITSSLWNQIREVENPPYPIFVFSTNSVDEEKSNLGEITQREWKQEDPALNKYVGHSLLPVESPN